MAPDWVLGIVLLLRYMIEVCLILICLDLGRRVGEGGEADSLSQYVLGAIGGSVAMVFLAFMPFQWPG